MRRTRGKLGILGNRKNAWARRNYFALFLCATVTLFFCNTLIITWYLGDNSLLSSVQGKLGELNEHAWWAAPVRERVTTSSQNQNPPLLERAAKSIIRRKENLRAKFDTTKENELDSFPFVWREASGSTSFVLADAEIGEWHELHDGKVAFKFKEQKLIKADQSWSVELRDLKRDLYILLVEGQSMMRFGKEDEYRVLYAGFFSVFDGVKQKVHEVGNYVDFLPPKQILNAPVEKQTIVLMLAAYRDPMCGNTLYEAFNSAEYPERVSAIVIQQNGPNDVDCLEDYCAIAKRFGKECYPEKVKVQNVELDVARGVMGARYRQSLFIEDQEFCLQTDSHSIFETHWDTIALEDWMLTDNEMAVITGYPNRVGHKGNQRHSPQRCSTKWGNDGEVVHGGNAALNIKPGPTPFLIPFFGAGTSFSKCHANLNVPYDPYMSHLFGGEEFNRAIRLFTAGYDLYGPKRNFVYHFYDKDPKPTWADKPRDRGFFSISTKQRKVVGSQATARWRALLGLELTSKNPKVSQFAMQDASYFGLGVRRRKEQYEIFSGVNLNQRTAEDKCGLLGRLKWVPYSYEEPFYPAGSRCPYVTTKEIRENCCTTLAMVEQSTTEMLAMKNVALVDAVEASPFMETSVLHPGEPWLSPLSSNALKGKCYTFDAEREQEEDIGDDEIILQN